MRSESETEDDRSLEPSNSDDDTSNFHKKSKISHTRNALFSLSVLDVCKRLPSGLDQSILGSQLSICWTGLLPSSPKADSGPFHGYPPQHLHTNHENRLPGSCAAGASEPLAKDSGFHLLNRSGGAYRPPHLCEAKVQSMAKYKDFYNNETFGSFENLSLERAEEERRRRDSFGLIRKEKHNAFEENQNKTVYVHKENLKPENGLLLEASGSCKIITNRYNESEECVASQAEARASAGDAFSAQTSASTFLFPSVLDSRSLIGSLTDTFTSELSETKTDQIEGYRFRSSGLDDQFLSENKLAGGIAPGYLKEGFEMSTTHTEEASHLNSTNSLSERKELMQNLMESTTSPAVDEISGKVLRAESISTSKSFHTWLRIPTSMKQNVTPLVLPHKFFELHMLPDPIGHYSTNHNSLKGWSTSNRNGIHPTDADHGESHYLSSEKKGKHKKNVETSSILNRKSADEIRFSEIEGLLQDLQTTEFPGIQRDSVSMSTGDGIMKPHMFPSESGSIKINCESIMSSSSSKQTLAINIEENPSSCNCNKAKIGFNRRCEPNCMLSSSIGFYGSAESQGELWLPDEDSLITVNDYILPQESTSMSAGRLFEETCLTSSSQFYVADKPTALNLDSYDIIGSKNSKADLHTQQGYPQFDHYQMNTGRATFKPSDAQQVQMQSSNLKTNINAPDILHHIAENLISDHFQHPRTDRRRFGHPMKSPFPQQMPVPNNFSHNQVRGFPRGSHSPNHICGMTSYRQELRPPQYFPCHYQQQHYGGFTMPNSDHTAGVIGNQGAAGKAFQMPNSGRTADGNQAAVAKPFQMEVTPRQTNPSPIAGRGSVNFGKAVGTGVWYGQQLP